MIYQPVKPVDQVRDRLTILESKLSRLHGGLPQFDVGKAALADIRAPPEFRLGLAGAQTAQQVFRIELDPDRVFGECRRIEELGRLFDRVVIIGLKLDLIAVGVA